MTDDASQADRAGASDDAPAIVLAPLDNVAICRRNVIAGEMLIIEGDAIVARSDVPLGHKIARLVIELDGAVVKYGMTIGVATAAIAPGEWVHLHNLSSNYISTHTRDTEARS